MHLSRGVSKWLERWKSSGASATLGWCLALVQCNGHREGELYASEHRRIQVHDRPPSFRGAPDDDARRHYRKGKTTDSDPQTKHPDDGKEEGDADHDRRQYARNLPSDIRFRLRHLLSTLRLRSSFYHAPVPGKYYLHKTVHAHKV